MVGQFYIQTSLISNANSVARWSGGTVLALYPRGLEFYALGLHFAITFFAITFFFILVKIVNFFLLSFQLFHFTFNQNVSIRVRVWVWVRFRVRVGDILRVRVRVRVRVGDIVDRSSNRSSNR